MKKQPLDTNTAQWNAINHDGAHLLIVAGPGTGKTHTLTHRITRFSSETNEGILAVTFTKKAADELRMRVSEKIGDKGSNVFIGTFHQYCLGLIRPESKALGIGNDFTVINDSHKASIGNKLWPKEKLSSQKRKFAEISRWKSSGLHGEIPEDVLKYNELLRKNDMLDYDDVLLETLRLFDESDKVLRQQQQTFPYVFVDEYQDINPVQYELLKYLIGETGCLTAIGDPNQAIYGFRGSNPSYFHSFKDDFPGAEVISFQDNYRSGENILSASAQVLNNRGEIFVPELTANIHAQGRLTIHEAQSEKAEAEYVVHSIEKIIGGTSMFSRDSGRVGEQELHEIGLGDIAVLYRIHSQANELRKALERSGMPFNVVEKKENDNSNLGPDYEQELYFEADKISLMSIHASKGLEFEVVFIVGCEDGILPLHIENLCGDIDEERRLFYVGMTRAKRFLYCIYAKKRVFFGKTYKNSISPFLSVIEEKLKEIDLPKIIKIKEKDQQLDLFSS